MSNDLTSEPERNLHDSLVELGVSQLEMQANATGEQVLLNTMRVDDPNSNNTFQSSEVVRVSAKTDGFGELEVFVKTGEPELEPLLFPDALSDGTFVYSEKVGVQDFPAYWSSIQADPVKRKVALEDVTTILVDETLRLKNLSCGGEVIVGEKKRTLDKLGLGSRVGDFKNIDDLIMYGARINVSSYLVSSTNYGFEGCGIIFEILAAAPDKQICRDTVAKNIRVTSTGDYVIIDGDKSSYENPMLMAVYFATQGSLELELDEIEFVKEKFLEQFYGESRTDEHDKLFYALMVDRTLRFSGHAGEKIYGGDSLNSDPKVLATYKNDLEKAMYAVGKLTEFVCGRASLQLNRLGEELIREYRLVDCDDVLERLEIRSEYELNVCNLN